MLGPASGKYGYLRSLGFNLAVVAACVLFTAYYAYSSGLDAKWDLRNCHFWSVWAMLNDRTFADVAPAQIQSWVNPVPYIPSYFLIQFASPLVTTIILGGVAGLNGAVLFPLARGLAAPAGALPSLWLAVAMTACGLTGPMFLSEVGTSFADVTGSILVLAALLSLYAEGAKGFAD